MSALSEARAHVAKAREFLEAAEVTHELGLNSAATSSAVTSAINSKDAICLRLTGRTAKSEKRAQAIAELKDSGAVGQAQSASFERILRLKPKAQYQAIAVSSRDAVKAIGWAQNLLTAAEDVVLR